METHFLFVLFVSFAIGRSHDICENAEPMNNNDDYQSEKTVQERTLQTLEILHRYTAGGKCREAWADDIHSIAHGNDQAFHESISKYLNATWLTYSYRTLADGPGLEHEPPVGWRLIKASYPVNRGMVGLHSLAFQNEENPKLVMFATRGTWADEVQEHLEEQSDVCAGWYLFDFKMPWYCNKFTPKQLNYFAQLTEFVSEVREAVSQDEGLCFAFTGHSLGAILSQLMSTAFHGDMPAFAFGGPGVKYPAKKLGLQLVDENLFNIFTEFDPIVAIPFLYSNQSGWECTYRKQFIPKYCYQCFTDNNFSFLTMENSCGQCFKSEHETGDDLHDFVFHQKKRPHCRRFAKNVQAHLSKMHYESQLDILPSFL